jgi:hypothetical protein
MFLALVAALAPTATIHLVFVTSTREIREAAINASCADADVRTRSSPPLPTLDQPRFLLPRVRDVKALEQRPTSLQVGIAAKVGRHILLLLHLEHRAELLAPGAATFLALT